MRAPIEAAEAETRAVTNIQHVDHEENHVFESTKVTGSAPCFTRFPARRVNVANVSVKTSKAAVSVCCADALCCELPAGPGHER